MWCCWCTPRLWNVHTAAWVWLRSWWTRHRVRWWSASMHSTSPSTCARATGQPYTSTQRPSSSREWLPFVPSSVPSSPYGLEFISVQFKMVSSRLEMPTYTLLCISEVSPVSVAFETLKQFQCLLDWWRPSCPFKEDCWALLCPRLSCAWSDIKIQDQSDWLHWFLRLLLVWRLDEGPLRKTSSVTSVLKMKTAGCPCRNLWWFPVAAHLFFCFLSSSCNKVGPTASADSPSGQSSIFSYHQGNFFHHPCFKTPQNWPATQIWLINWLASQQLAWAMLPNLRTTWLVM